ncbi:MAG: hypothetical protein HWE22_14645 [Flavobacteriales bacterium]|nr:hypothetical protein [Flavobacteriales bacterium]
MKWVTYFSFIAFVSFSCGSQPKETLQNGELDDMITVAFNQECNDSSCVEPLLTHIIDFRISTSAENKGKSIYHERIKSLRRILLNDTLYRYNLGKVNMDLLEVDTLLTLAREKKLLCEKTPNLIHPILIESSRRFTDSVFLNLFVNRDKVGWFNNQLKRLNE